MLPHRRGAPGARRLLRHRGQGPRAAQAAARDRTSCRGTSAGSEWLLLDTATQGMRGHYAERGEYSTIPFWYVWSAELDLMAQLAGMRLRERWDGWTREPLPRRQPPAPLGLGETLTRRRLSLTLALRCS